MTSISQPSVSVAIVGANTTVENEEQRVLFVGTSLATGSDGILQTNLGNSESDLETLFGSTSPIAGMIRAARKVNEVTRFDAIGLEISGAAATTSVAIGSPTADGSLTVTIGSEVDYTFTVTFLSTDADTAISLALTAAINANTLVPVTAVDATGSVTLTSDVDGLNGNNIGISASATGTTVTASVFTTGSGNPVLTNVFDAIGDERYQTIIWEYVDVVTELDVLVNFLDGRFNVNNKVLDGVGFVTESSTDTLIDAAVTARNSQSLVYIGSSLETETNYIAPAQFEMDWIKSAQVGAIRALRLTEGASISQFVISSAGPLDAFGGAALASKPHFNTPYPDLPIIATGRGWTDLQIEALATAGASSLGNNIAKNSAIAGEFVTTYKTDTAGNPDISFKYLNYVSTISGIREYFFNNYRSRFAQSRLTTGDVIRGRDMANELTIRAYTVQLFGDLSGVDFVLVQSGEAALQFFKTNLSVTLDLTTGTVTIFMLVPIVVQLREIIATVQLSFTA